RDSNRLEKTGCSRPGGVSLRAGTPSARHRLLSRNARGTFASIYRPGSWRRAKDRVPSWKRKSNSAHSCRDSRTRPKQWKDMDISRRSQTETRRLGLAISYAKVSRLWHLLAVGVPFDPAQQSQTKSHEEFGF